MLQLSHNRFAAAGPSPRQPLSTMQAFLNPAPLRPPGPCAPLLCSPFANTTKPLQTRRPGASAPTRRARLLPRCSAASPHPEMPSGQPDDDDDNTPEKDADPDAIDPDSVPTEASFSSELLRRRISDLANRREDDDDDDENAQSATVDQVLDLFAVHDQDDVTPEQAQQMIDNFENLSKVFVIVFTSSKDGVDGVYSLAVGDDSIVLAFQQREDAHRYAVCLQAQKFPEPQICEMRTNELCDFCRESGFRLGFVPKNMPITPPDESAVEDLDAWRGIPPPESKGTSMSDEDIDAMRKRFDSLFGQ